MEGLGGEAGWLLLFLLSWVGWAYGYGGVGGVGGGGGGGGMHDKGHTYKQVATEASLLLWGGVRWRALLGRAGERLRG